MGQEEELSISSRTAVSQAVNKSQDGEPKGNPLSPTQNQNEQGQGNTIGPAEGDRVEITAEAKEQNRADRGADGKRTNSSTPNRSRETPEVEDQQGAERGAQQKVQNARDENERGLGSVIEADAGAQAVVSRQSDSPVNNPPGRPNEDIRGLSNTAESQGGSQRAEAEDPVAREVRESRQITQSSVGGQNIREAKESLEASEERQERVEKREAPLFNSPTPFEVDRKEPADAEQVAETDQDRLAQPTEPNEQEQSNRLDQEPPPTSPASVQTEVGQNLDRLI